MDLRPVFVILSVFQNGKVKPAKGIAELFKLFGITAVSAVKHLALRRNKRKGAGFRLVRVQETPGEMLGRKDMDGKLLRKFNRCVPVFFRNYVQVKAPIFKMFPDAQRHHDFFDFRFQRHQGGIIQMIPVVMGNHQQINVGDILRRVDIASGKGLIDERQR